MRGAYQQNEGRGRLGQLTRGYGSSQSARGARGRWPGAQTWDIVPHSARRADFLSPLAAWDTTSPAACTPLFQPSPSAERVGIAANRDAGAPIASSAGARPPRAIAPLSRASDAQIKPAASRGGRPVDEAADPEPASSSMGARSDSAREYPSHPAHRAATAQFGAVDAEALPSTFFVPMALRTRTAGENWRAVRDTHVSLPASRRIFLFCYGRGEIRCCSVIV